MNNLELQKKSKKTSFRLKNKATDKDGIVFIHDQESSETSFITELKKLTGIENDDLMEEIIASAAQGLPIKKNFTHTLNVSTQALAEAVPKDLNETWLCLQANNLFLQGMYYLDKANRTDFPLSEFYMKASIKLLRLHNETVETLHRYRHKGEQTMTVQHVNVSNGGQAIVGHIKT